MSKRSYGQYCGLAHALDLVGERWSLLIIRELMTGPKRYKDLLKRLPGLGTNLLANRLHGMEKEGIVVRRMLPPPASTEAYDLSDHGHALEPALLALAQWGYQTLPPPGKKTVHFASWSVLAMKAVFRPDQAHGIDETYEYRVDDEVFHAQVRNETLTTYQGPAHHPDFILTTDGKTFLALVSGTLDINEAVDRITLTGNRGAFTRSLRLFDLAPPHHRHKVAFKAIDLTGRGRTAPGAHKLL